MPDRETCTSRFALKLRSKEHDFLKNEADAADKSIAAYIREKLGFDEAPPVGRRWPEDPAERQWRKTA